jgi:hypothetical protein
MPARIYPAKGLGISYLTLIVIRISYLTPIARNIFPIILLRKGLEGVGENKEEPGVLIVV